MKHLIRTSLVFFAFWSAVEVFPLNSALAQTSMGTNLAATNRLIFPLTNGPGFTNTLVQVRATNLATLQRTDLVELLLSLQTNIELTLPVLSTLTTNATFQATPGGPPVPAVVAPLTNSSTPVSTPAGQAAAVTGTPTNISTALGSNIVELDPATFQGIVSLQNDLELALPVLQMLNGTAPSETNTATNTILSPTGVTNPFAAPETNAPVVPLTNRFFLPLTNQSHMFTIPSPF